MKDNLNQKGIRRPRPFLILAALFIGGIILRGCSEQMSVPSQQTYHDSLWGGTVSPEGSSFRNPDGSVSGYTPGVGSTGTHGDP